MKRFDNAPFTLLGVNSDEDRDEIRRVCKEEDLTWRSWWDRGIDGPIHEAWNVVARPAVFLLDHEGVVRYKNVFDEELDQAIEKLVDEARTAQGSKS